jgi:glycosyltransferase involved in cell wall biosynthesis
VESNEVNPPRVLFLAGRDGLHPGAAGGDHQAWQWAKHLSAIGWTVEYIAQSAPGRPRTEECDGISVLRLGRGPALAWRAAMHYRRHARKIDLVYEDPIGAGRTPYLAPLYSRAPVIAVWHQVSADLLRSLHPRPVAKTMSLVERAVAACYRRSLLWAPSAERAGEIAKELRIPQDRIVVIPPTLADDIDIATQPSTAALHVLCMGLIRPYKNFEHVIEAMITVRAKVPSAILIIAGRRSGAQYADALRVAVESAGLHGAVQFHFDVSDEDRQQLMRDAAALVLPSLLEGFGIVSIEANAEGTPVVASSGVPVAAVDDAVNGLRYPFGDIDALAKCLVLLLTDSQLRQRLGVGAITHASALTVAAVAPQFDALVERAMNERNPVIPQTGREARK